MFEQFKKKLKSLFKSSKNEEQKQEFLPPKSEKKKKPKEDELAKYAPKQHAVGIAVETKEPEEKHEEKPELLPPLPAQDQKKLEIKQEEEPSGIFSIFKSKNKTVTLSRENFESFFVQLELLLLENNVAIEVVDKIKENLEKDLINIQVKKGEIEKSIKESLKKTLESILIEPNFDLIRIIKDKKEPFVIVFFGINGSGKTTTIAKIASLLLKNNISCVLAAADTFRAASIEQLTKHAEALKIPVIKHDYKADPSAVAFDAVKHAKARGIKAVLIDTAGRMHTKENLINEMGKLCKVTNPDLKIFVGESITGNDATEQAKVFNESIGIDAIILTKADVDEKGGTAISVSFVTKKPILFLGIGQKYENLKIFSKRDMIKELELDGF